MSWEIAGAALLGCLLLFAILQPLLFPARARPAVYVPPEPEETRRGIALTALREIEFDRETGKLSDEDYASLKSAYTAEAVAAMRADDAEMAASDIEAMVAAGRQRLEGIAIECQRCGPRPERDALFCSSCGERLSTGARCGSCRAVLPPDGRFCERCGTAAVAA